MCMWKISFPVDVAKGEGTSLNVSTANVVSCLAMRFVVFHIE